MEDRLDPSMLLRAFQQETATRGKLKIFLGMAAGVGKTYSMLEAAHKKQKEGVDLYVGCVVTHGRAETAQLLEGLAILPLKTIMYRDKALQEFDLEGALQLNPSLILVDELAHTNIPGSRHTKRWQDVQELLEAGIDVYTTLNIQHVESFKDIVEKITQVKIQETVPDSVLETASEVELVDVTPGELIERLREGRVYTAELTDLAVQNFFQEDRLTALREIALRFTAEVVDKALHTMWTTLQRRQGWRPRERLLVIIYPSLEMPYLIRAARRRSFMLHAPWTALYVDIGKTLTEAQRAVLAKNLALARDLGAEVVTIKDPHLASGIQRVVQQKEITQIILGHTPRYLKGFFQRSLIYQLTRLNRDVDIYFIQHTPATSQEPSPFKKWQQLRAYYNSFMGFLIVSILSVGLWRYTEGVFVFAFLVLVTGYLFCRQGNLKAQQALLLRQEQTTHAMYEIVREMADAPSTADLFAIFKEKVGKMLHGACEIFIPHQGSISASLQEAWDLEKNVIQWVWEHGKEAGWSTQTLASSPYYYIPLKGASVLGVLGFRPQPGCSLLPQQKNFLYTVAQQLAHHLESQEAQEKDREKRSLQKIEKIYSRVLRILDQQLRPLLMTMQEALTLLKPNVQPPSHPSLGVALATLDQLMRVSENASSMVHLSSGLTSFQKTPQNIETMIHAVLSRLSKWLKHHQVVVNIAKNLPPISCDQALMEVLMAHLISNAAQYSLPETTIDIHAEMIDQEFIFSVADEGPGIPEELMDRIFEKFYSVPGTVSTGLGLGLSIVSSIASLHNGRVKVKNRAHQGAIFSLIMPVS